MSETDTAHRNAEEGMGLFKAAMLLLALLAVLLTLAFGADWLLRTDNFPVRHVRFEGEFKHVTQQELQNAVMSVVHGNFFLIDLDAVKVHVESLPWVYKASVRRQWPQDIYVHFTEQQLVARWGNSAFLNPAGDVVHVTGSDLPMDLPQLEGPDGTGTQVLESYKSLGRILAAAGLKLEQITLTPRRTWRLVLTNEMVLVLDREQPELKLERFARVYVQSLVHLASGIKQVDLRYTNGFAIEPASSHAAVSSNAPRRLVPAGSGRTGMANKG
ncbi:MAG: cell division protein FtsQ/DivIB [Sulfuricaulis sp.]